MKCPTCGTPLTPNTIGECPNCDGRSAGPRKVIGLALLDSISMVGCLVVVALAAIGLVTLVFMWDRIFG